MTLSLTPNSGKQPKGDDICESANSKTFELEQKIAALKRENSSLQREKEIIQQQCKELEQENKILKKDLECAKQIIRRAKDISPIMRLSLKRVLRLAHHACMDLERTVGGWILRMGDKARKFRRLADIWDLLSQDEFILSEIFPPEKLIAVDLIRPPKRRERPKPPEKKTRPLIRHGYYLTGEMAKQVRPSYPPEDVIRNRTMLLVQSG